MLQENQVYLFSFTFPTDFGSIMADENQNEVKDEVAEVSFSLLIFNL